VAAGKASTIIVLHPEGVTAANAEAIKVSVAMSLTALGAPAQQRVVVQGACGCVAALTTQSSATTLACWAGRPC
jgi:hypothetical protein